MSEAPIGLVLSIRPVFAEAIFRREKTVELRRAFHRRWAGAKVLFYASAPRMAVLGTATIAQVERLEIAELWAKHGQSIGGTRERADQYFTGRAAGYALSVTDTKRFERPVTLDELRERFGSVRPPQSYSVIRHGTVWAWALDTS